jgi:hypothetical protein
MRDRGISCATSQDRMAQKKNWLYNPYFIEYEKIIFTFS